MKKWMRYVKPYKLYFILGPLCMLVEVFGEVFMPKLMAQIINNATIGEGSLGINFGIMFAMILTAVLMMVGGVGGAYFGAKASVNFASDLRLDVYKKVQSYSFSNIDKYSTGALVTRLTTDVTQMQNMVSMLIRMA